MFFSSFTIQFNRCYGAKKKFLEPYTAGKISTENLLDNVLTYISEHFCFYTLCIISAYKYVKKLRKCK